MTQFHFRHGAALNERDNSHVCVGKAGKSGYLTRSENCSRCGGRGGSDAWAYTGWTCYRCHGNCTEPVTYRVFTADRLDVLNIAAQKKEDKRVAAAAKKDAVKRLEFIAWAKPQGALIGAILTAKNNTFLSDLASKLRQHWTLSERQIEAAAKSIERTVERKAQDASSEFVGEVKERLDLEVKVIGVYGTEGFYGHTDIVKMVDTDGNLFTWFASGYSGIERGDNLTLRGTVKKHDTYKGVKQTILTRCKFEKFNILTADEAANMEVIA